MRSSAVALGFFSVLAFGPARASAERLNQLDFATIAGRLDTARMEHMKHGGFRVFIDKHGKPAERDQQPKDLTGGRFVIVRQQSRSIPGKPFHSESFGEKEIVVLGAQGKSGESKDQTTQTTYLLKPGATRPRFLMATTSNDRRTADGISVMRFIGRGLGGSQRSSSSAFIVGSRLGETAWKHEAVTSRLGQKVPSMGRVTQQASSAFSQHNQPPSRMTRLRNAVFGRR